MGLNIGPVTSALSALRSAPEFGQTRLRSGDALRAREPREQSGREPLAREPFVARNPNEVRAGFGEGTISPVTAALRTIDRTIEGVRRNTPTIQDIREQFQTAYAERRAETFRTTRGQAAGNPLQALEPGAGRASRLVREFAATDTPEGRAGLTPEREPILGANRAEESERASALAARDEAGETNRVDPAEVRAARVEAAREREPAERPRLDVRV